MPKQLWKAGYYLFLAYWIVMLLGIGATYIADELLHSPAPDWSCIPAPYAPSDSIILPLYPLISLIVWPWFAWVYLAGLPPAITPIREMLKLSVFWTAITAALDLVGWLFIPHDWQMPWYGF